MFCHVYEWASISFPLLGMYCSLVKNGSNMKIQSLGLLGKWLIIQIQHIFFYIHLSTLAWTIPWTEEPGRLQAMGWRRVGHDWATSLSLFTLMHWRSKWQPIPVFFPGESQGRGSLVGCRLGGHTESDTTEATQQQQQQDIFVNSCVIDWRTKEKGKLNICH